MNIARLNQIWSAFVAHARAGNWPSIRIIGIKAASKFLEFLLLPAGLAFVLVIRLIRPWFLVRINILTSERLGHFAANTELYLCERDAGVNTPKLPYVDLWYHNWPVSNRQLAKMWGRVLHVGPRWLLAPVSRMNSLIPGGEAHRIGENTQLDRDVHNLLDRFPPHLSFLSEEEKRGEDGLRALGIPQGASFVCLIVRDSGYLEKSLPWKRWNYHDYRDCNVQNYVLAAQELTKRGYYVVRVGAVVKEAMNVNHPMIIDYAVNGTRSDFMDIYLGAKCEFCISNGTGFDAVSYIFRRPIVYVDVAPAGPLSTSSSKFLTTIKKYWLRDEVRFMTFREIFESGAAYFYYSSEYERKRIELRESTPEEIAAVVLEMESRLNGAWQSTEEDETLQRRFWEIFPKQTRANWSSETLHGDIRSRIGTDFLRRNAALLQ